MSKFWKQSYLYQASGFWKILYIPLKSIGSCMTHKISWERLILLTHFLPMHPFSILWKHQKIVRFSDIFREERNGAFGWKGYCLKRVNPFIPIVEKCPNLKACCANLTVHLPRDIKILGWYSTELVLPHGEKVSL